MTMEHPLLSISKNHCCDGTINERQSLITNQTSKLISSTVDLKTTKGRRSIRAPWVFIEITIGVLLVLVIATVLKSQIQKLVEGHPTPLQESAILDSTTAVTLEETDVGISQSVEMEHSLRTESTKDHIAPCQDEYPCFEPAKVLVSTTNQGFPSFLSYAHKGLLVVDYDSRALKINGDRVFFLGGSMHPARATPMTWEYALDNAVQNGLNLLTIYVFWSDHQPLPNNELNWTFPDWSSMSSSSSSPYSSTFNIKTEGWDLAKAIRLAANRGLFVHLRIGPYDCAEYTYGGIPEWLLFKYPNMELRRPNKEWLVAMESFVVKLIRYISENRLWADQGGPIIMGQIENELGSGDDDGSVNDNDQSDARLWVASDGEFMEVGDSKKDRHSPFRRATLQDYADWCGAIAQKHAPNVTWTMCNGLSANNTIHTCNAIDNGPSWLENHGNNGRIQVDQPPLLTEFEEGFQDWGETPQEPNDYFWGKTAAASTKEALRWFARGGTHLNYYMFWGAYNRGRQAAGGITNQYATDGALCSSGQRHEPKYSHYRSLHHVMASIAHILLTCETALGKAKPVEVLDDNSREWVIGRKQRVFQYNPIEGDKHLRTNESNPLHYVSFIENDERKTVLVRIPFPDNPVQYSRFSISPMSAILVVDGKLAFDAATIDPQAMSFQRDIVHATDLVGWAFWEEPIGASENEPLTQIDTSPIEQTELNVHISNVWSDYAWYETIFSIENDEYMEGGRLYIESQRSNALSVFVNNSFVGSVEDHSHIFEGNWTMGISIGALSQGNYKLSILSESLGHSNLVGRFGNSGTGSKRKGITGRVFLSSEGGTTNTSLVDGEREWKSLPGLHGERLSLHLNKTLSRKDGDVPSPTWASFLFQSPTFDPGFQSLFLQLTVGRGHLWLNGRDLGRYWNITQGETSDYSQEYYFLPIDYLLPNGELNEIILFDALGGSLLDLQKSSKLILSWISPATLPTLMDEVNYPFACI